MDASLSIKVHFDNAKWFTTLWKNTMHVHTDHQPTVMSSQSSNNALFMSVNMYHNENVWESMWQKKLYIFIHDECTK